MAKNPNGNGTLDVNSLSVSELEALLQAKKEEQARYAAEHAVEARKAVEQYLKEHWHGISLAQVWMANGKTPERKTYKNPTNGQSYSYSGRGKVPEWLKGTDGKPNAAYEVKSN